MILSRFTSFKAFLRSFAKRWGKVCQWYESVSYLYRFMYTNVNIITADVWKSSIKMLLLFPAQQGYKPWLCSIIRTKYVSISVEWFSFLSIQCTLLTVGKKMSNFTTVHLIGRKTSLHNTWGQGVSYRVQYDWHTYNHHRTCGIHDYHTMEHPTHKRSRWCILSVLQCK